MDKTNSILGIAISAMVVVVVFGIVIFPSSSTTSDPPLFASNGGNNNLKSVGEETKLAPKQQNQIDSGKMPLTDLFEKSDDGVVKVSVKKKEDKGSRDDSVGSGFIYDVNGNIITNNHVVRNGEKITVTFLDGSQYNAEIVGTDPFTDLAVIKVDAQPQLLHPLPIGSSSKISVGDRVAAIGNPFGLSGSMTAGIVSQMGRLLQVPTGGGFSIPDVIQTDAAVNPGNSGGPLLNMRGEVVGVTTAVQSATGDFAGIGFAVPSDTITKIVPTLIEKGQYNHPWLGISGIDIDPDLAKVLGIKDTKGFLIVRVVDGSPADKAGLMGSSKTKTVEGTPYKIGGDIITSIDGKKVRKIDDILIHLQREKKAGDDVVLGILRNGEHIEVGLTLEKRPPSSEIDR